jgi:hypothetical protein
MTKSIRLNTKENSRLSRADFPPVHAGKASKLGLMLSSATEHTPLSYNVRTISQAIAEIAFLSDEQIEQVDRIYGIEMPAISFEELHEWHDLDGQIALLSSEL